MNSYLAQMANAEASMRSLHEKLIEAGYVWDGMDGYTKSFADKPCPYCTGVLTGLPGNACENCMNTGLSNPTKGT